MIYFRDEEYFGVINEQAGKIHKKISLKDGFNVLKKQYIQNGTNKTFVDYVITIYNNPPQQYTETTTVPDTNNVVYNTEQTKENEESAKMAMNAPNNYSINYTTSVTGQNEKKEVITNKNQLTLEQYNFLYN